jgi:hypothetical protein
MEYLWLIQTYVACYSLHGIDLEALGATSELVRTFGASRPKRCRGCIMAGRSGISWQSLDTHEHRCRNGKQLLGEDRLG